MSRKKENSLVRGGTREFKRGKEGNEYL